MDLTDIDQILSTRLSKKRYRHTHFVLQQALELAKLYQADVNTVTWAALLHDITKEEDEKLQLQKLLKSDIIFSKEILDSPAVYHSKTGAIFAQQELSVCDEEVLNAIRYHTTARSEMSLIEKIIFVADATSFDRNYPGVKKLRELSFLNLDKCVFLCVQDSLENLLRGKLPIPIETIACYNHFVDQFGGRANNDKE